MFVDAYTNIYRRVFVISYHHDYIITTTLPPTSPYRHISRQLIYRRSNGGVDFTDFRTSEDYELGFGEPTQDFYLGHGHVAALTSDRRVPTDMHIGWHIGQEYYVFTYGWRCHGDGVLRGCIEIIYLIEFVSSLSILLITLFLI